MKQLSDLLKLKSFTRDHRNTYEYQAYGNRLAEEFRDTRHRALYIKLAKNEPRNLLERAREFVVSQKHATTPGKLFMWKLKQLRDEMKDVEKHPEKP